jgi:hypothetical protein
MADTLPVFFLIFLLIAGLEGYLLRVLLDLDLDPALLVSFWLNLLTSAFGFAASYAFRPPRGLFFESRDALAGPGTTGSGTADTGT